MPPVPIPKPSPQSSPRPASTTPAPTPTPTPAHDIKDFKAWYRPGDSPRTKQALVEYVYARNRGEDLANELSYIHDVYGAGVADMIRQRAPEMERAQTAAKPGPQPADPSYGTTATTATGDVVTGADITAQDLLDANPSYGDLGTAQQALNLFKQTPAGMAQLRTTIVNARNQFFLSLAGVTPSYADKRVQLTPPSPLAITDGTGIAKLGNVAAAGVAGGAGDTASGTTTFANALAAPRAAGYDVTGLQRRLVAGGLLLEGTYSPGVYDPATIAANSKVISEAAEMKIAVSTRLDQRVANPPLPQGIGPETRADPMAVDSYVKQTFQKAAGRLPTAEELSKYTSDYRGFEDQAYKSGVAQARGSTQAAGGQIYNYNPQTDVAAEIAQGQPAQAYVGQDWVGSINHILGK